MNDTVLLDNKSNVLGDGQVFERVDGRLRFDHRQVRDEVARVTVDQDERHQAKCSFQHPVGMVTHRRRTAFNQTNISFHFFDQLKERIPF